MKIIVVEKNNQIQNIIKKVIRKVDIHEKSDDLSIYNFSNYNNELKNIINKSSERKIYIISSDLEFGIKLGQIIRDADWDSYIIFISSKADMFEPIHRNIHNIYSIILKDENLSDNLFKDIHDIYRKKFDHRMFMYQSREFSIQIYFHAIMYIYRDKEERKIVIKTMEQDYMINLSLAEALNRLDNRFRLVHRSCIVNLDQVRVFNWSKGYFALKDNTKVYILSKKFKKEVTKIYDENNNHNK